MIKVTLTGRRFYLELDTIHPALKYSRGGRGKLKVAEEVAERNGDEDLLP